MYEKVKIFAGPKALPDGGRIFKTLEIPDLDHPPGRRIKHPGTSYFRKYIAVNPLLI